MTRVPGATSPPKPEDHVAGSRAHWPAKLPAATALRHASHLPAAWQAGRASQGGFQPFVCRGAKLRPWRIFSGVLPKAWFRRDKLGESLISSFRASGDSLTQELHLPRLFAQCNAVYGHDNNLIGGGEIRGSVGAERHSAEQDLTSMCKINKPAVAPRGQRNDPQGEETRRLGAVFNAAAASATGGPIRDADVPLEVRWPAPVAYSISVQYTQR